MLNMTSPQPSNLEPAQPTPQPYSAAADGRRWLVASVIAILVLGGVNVLTHTAVGWLVGPAVGVLAFFLVPAARPAGPKS